VLWVRITQHGAFLALTPSIDKKRAEAIFPFRGVVTHLCSWLHCAGNALWKKK
jgi:hypothetical protein